jgi:hypothetical protein
VRPSNKAWSLTVRKGSLHLDAPHGSFEVRAIAPEVMPVVTALPDGTEVECEGSFDGGGTITHLVVTKVRRILRDLSGRVLQLPDAIVAADGRLAAARARHHFAAGRYEQAAIDVGSLLALGDDQALADFERLPAAHQQPLLEALVAWQASRPASWRALKHLALAQWTAAHLDEAVEQGLANGGVFGAAPGVRVEDLVEELERRKRPTKTWTKQTQRLRRAQATEGDTVYRIVTEVEAPRVVGADLQGVYVAGDGQVLVHYALDGRELKRWARLAADRVVEGVALQLEVDEPAGVRLSDGKQLFTFAHRIAHHDGELLWGIHAKDPAKHTMRSEIRHIATGYVIAKLESWVDDVTWNAHHIFIHGDKPQTLTREGRLVHAGVYPAPETVDIETASGRCTIPAAHAPWLFDDFRAVDAGGWDVRIYKRDLYLAPSEPGATWVHLTLAKEAERVDLAPPWLAIQHIDQPIVLVALAEAMSAIEIRVDGKRFLKRGKTDHTLAVPDEHVALYDTLVEIGVTPPIPAIRRDAHLHARLGREQALPSDVLTRVLIDHAPACVEHSDYFVDADDTIYARLSAAFGDDHVHVREIDRVEDASGVVLTIEVSRGGKKLRRQCASALDAVMVTIDKLVDELGARRRIFALEDARQHRRTYLLITREQRGAIVGAGYEGIGAGPRVR